MNEVRLERFLGGISRMTLNRPGRMNALTPAVFASMQDTLRTVEQDRTRVLILAGEGERALSAGYDLSRLGDLAAMPVTEFVELEHHFNAVVTGLHRLPFPVIAAVQGVASGGGLSLALAADLRVASTDARFNASFATAGLSIGELGTSWLLPRLVGPGIAAELAYTGRMVHAEEALAIGLVDQIIPTSDLDDHVLSLAEQLAKPGADRGPGKRTLRAHIEHPSLQASIDTSLGNRS